MVYQDHQALRVFLVTWGHREKMALKAQRENQERGVYQDREGCQAWRVMKALLDHQAHQGLKVDWAEKGFLENLERKELRENLASQEKWDQWEKGAWWGFLDLWESQDLQERRVIGVKWDIQDLPGKRDQ